MNVDCRDGKCGACVGEAFDPAADDVVECAHAGTDEHRIRVGDRARTARVAADLGRVEDLADAGRRCATDGCHAVRLYDDDDQPRGWIGLGPGTGHVHKPAP